MNLPTARGAQRAPAAVVRPGAGRLETRRVGYRAVLAPTGRLDEAATPDLVNAFFNAIEHGAQEVWFDLSRVTGVDHRGLRTLIRTLGFGHELERRTVAICPGGPVRQALDEAGVDLDVEIYGSLSAAQRAA